MVSTPWNVGLDLGMSSPSKKEYLVALSAALALHTSVVLGFESQPKGNAPVNGYRLSFSLGSEGASDAQNAQAEPEAQHPVETPEPEKVAQPEPDPEPTPAPQAHVETPPEPVQTKQADFAEVVKKHKPKEKTKKTAKKPEPKIKPTPRVAQVNEPPRKPEPVRKKENKPPPTEEPVQKVAQTKPVQEAPVTQDAPSQTTVVSSSSLKGTGGAAKSKQQGVSGGVAGVRADYLTMVQKYLARYKKYPRRARLRRQEGTSMVEFVITPSGEIANAALKDSSGYRTLDKEALLLLKRASPLPVPPKFTQDKMKVILPIAFILRTG